MQKPSVFLFPNFASFLTAYLEWMKATRPSFSLRWLAKRLQLKSHTYLLSLTKGTKSPSEDMLAKLVAEMGLSADEHTYLKALLGRENAKTTAEAAFFQEKITATKSEVSSLVLAHESFAAIADWYHIVIYEMMLLPDASSDAAWIADQLALPLQTVTEAIERLLRLGILLRQEDGSLKRISDNIYTSHNVPSAAIRSFHSQMLDRARQALMHYPVLSRVFLGYTLPFSSSRVKEVEDLLIEFRARFIKLMDGDEAADSVYHLALQFFPLTFPKHQEDHDQTLSQNP